MAALERDERLRVPRAEPVEVRAVLAAQVQQVLEAGRPGQVPLGAQLVELLPELADGAVLLPSPGRPLLEVAGQPLEGLVARGALGRRGDHRLLEEPRGALVEPLEKRPAPVRALRLPGDPRCRKGPAAGDGENQEGKKNRFRGPVSADLRPQGVPAPLF